MIKVPFPFDVRWLVSLLIGLSLALTFANHFTPFWQWSVLEQVLLGGYFVLVFSLVAYIAIVRFYWSRLAGFSRRAKIIWIVTSLLGGAILMVVIPVDIPKPLPSVQHTLVITATGQKNPQAQASQVWLRLRLAGGSVIPFSDMQAAACWETAADGAVRCLEPAQPAQLTWQGMLQRDVTLLFTAHPWSGIVEVSWDGESQRLDLYSENSIERVVTLPWQSNPTPSSTLVIVGLYGAYTLSFAVLVLVASVWLITRPVQAVKPVSVSWWEWVGYALLLIFVWMIWLLAFWPGLMVSDTVDQWHQMLSGSLNDWHPAFHTITMWLLTRLWMSPAIVALAQIFALGLIVAWAAMYFRQQGLSLPVIGFILFLFVLLPSQGAMIIFLVKDIPFAISVLLLTMFILKIVMSNGDWVKNDFGWVKLSLAATPMSLYRHNGLPIAIVTIIILLFVYRHQWRHLSLTLILTIGLWAGVHSPLYNKFNVNKNGQPAWKVTMLHHIAAHLANGAVVAEDDQQLLNKFRSPETGWPYDCFSVIPFHFDGHFNVNALFETGVQQLAQLNWRLFMRQPFIDVKHIACSSSLVWRITKNPNLGFYATVPLVFGEDGRVYTMLPESGMPQPELLPIRSLLPMLVSPLSQIVIRSHMPDFRWFVWQSPLYLYLFIGAATIASIRSKRWHYLLVLLPIILNSGILFFFAPVQDFRYQYPTFLVSLLLSGFLLFGISGAKATQADQPTG